MNIVKIIEKYISKIKPEIIFTHFYNDLNIDHQIVNKAVITSCRPQRKTSVKTLLFFEIPSSTEWQVSKSKNIFNPNWFEDIDAELNLKIKALKAYKNELRNWPHPRSIKGVKALATWRGASAGFGAAEALFLEGKFERNKVKKILIMGLPGLVTLASKLVPLIKAKWLNAISKKTSK